MTDHFEIWIMGMSDEEYENWLEDDASDKQEEKAINIREPPTDTELEALEAEQESEQSRDDQIRQEVEQRSGIRERVSGAIRGFLQRLSRT